MRKNYTPFNVASLIIILLSTLLLTATFQTTTSSEVRFDDPGLEQAVRDTIGKIEGDIQPNDVDLIQELDATGYGIESLEGIEALQELRTLNLEDNFVKSVSPLQELTKLETLSLRNNEITDLEDIEFDDIIFLNIRELSLRHNVKRDEEGNATRLSDITLLGQMIMLEELDLRDNHIEELAPLGNLRNIEELDLRENRIDNVEALEPLTRLKQLDLRDNQVEDVSSFSNLRSLQTLDIRGNRVKNIEAFEFLAQLEKLDARYNEIEDLSSLGRLKNLRELDVRGNEIESIEALIPHTQLEELNIRDNRIESLEPLTELTHLTYLNIHSNSDITSLAPLSDLVHLETLIMREVPIRDNGRFLENLTKLQRLNAIDTGFETIELEIIESLRNQGALKGEVRPVRMLHTLNAPEITRESGFYSEGFEIEIEAATEEGNIYYTLDGSEPDAHSEIYEEPLTIHSKDDRTFTVVRAKVLSEDNTMSETVTKSYFVHEDADDRFKVPVFSLVTEPANLFDEEYGIYHESNSQKRGSDWERPVHLDFFETDGRLAFKQELGVRLHGGVTRDYRHKSLRLYAKSEYDTEDYMRYDFFDGVERMNGEGTVTEFKRLLLRNSGNDWSHTMFNDALSQSLVKPLGTVETQAYRPAVVFINGEYFGIQNIRERFDEYYFKTHYGIAEEDLVILERDSTLYRGNPSEVAHYENMLNFIEENGLEDQTNYRYIETLIDTENYRDYFASQIYFGNSDWPSNNIRFWRKTTEQYEPDAPYGHDGRWRWLLFDTDHGFYHSDEPIGAKPYPRNHHHNTIDFVMGEFDGVDGTRKWPNFLFRSMMANEEFRTEFLNRINDLMNSYFLPNVVANQIDRKVEGIEDEMPAHIERWGAIESMDQWNMYIDRKYTFANERPELLRGFIMNGFDISDTITVNVENENEMGYVKLNTIAIQNELPGNTEESTWSGTYFSDVPMRVEAVAKEGYEFSHWEGIDLQEESGEFTPSTDVTLQAVFTPVSY